MQRSIRTRILSGFASTSGDPWSRQVSMQDVRKMARRWKVTLRCSASSVWLRVGGEGMRQNWEVKIFVDGADEPQAIGRKFTDENGVDRETAVVTAFTGSFDSR